jgi:hypothetical protein
VPQFVRHREPEQVGKIRTAKNHVVLDGITQDYSVTVLERKAKAQCIGA